MLEVGLGGRLDAVNIVDADVAVISSIGIDHADWLGNDIESIAVEKAGIMRPKIPTIFGGEHPPNAIIKRAQELGSPLIISGQNFHVEQNVANTSWRWRGQDKAGRAYKLA